MGIINGRIFLYSPRRPLADVPPLFFEREGESPDSSGCGGESRQLKNKYDIILL